SIRSGRPSNDGEHMCNSTLMAIMGRMAAYTGQEITWEQMMNSQERLVPEKISWDMALPIAPMAVPRRPQLLLHPAAGKEFTMKTSMPRRRFLGLAGTTLAAASVLPRGLAAEDAAPKKRRSIRKAIMGGTIGIKGSVLEKYRALKEAGFEGVEPN